MKKVITLLSLPLLLAFMWFNQVFAQSAVGDEAPAFELMNIDGEMVSLASFEDQKGAIVVFTCNHCPFAKMYEDRLVQLDNDYADKGFPVVAINPNDAEQYPEDSYKNMKKRAKEKGFTFPYLYDETQDIAKAYGATRTPHVFLVVNREDGQFIEYIGAIDDNAKDAESVEEEFLRNAIDAILDGGKPSPDNTKAVGCGIKWKKA